MHLNITGGKALMWRKGFFSGECNTLTKAVTDGDGRLFSTV